MDELSAVAPTGTASLIHLHQPGYVTPSRDSRSPKRRRDPDRRTLCGPYIRSRAEMVPLADALGWPGRRIGPDLPVWRWCGVCVGRALVVAGRIDAVVRILAGRSGS